MRCINTEIFIEKSNKIHNHKYNYSLSIYYKNENKIKIICPIHGLFEQTPNKHLQGKGCYQCGRIKQAVNETTKIHEFIKNADKKHNNYYDYSKVEYINSNTKINIICPVHGDFFQRPANHLSGNGCRKCGNQKISSSKNSTLNIFINKAKHIHGEFYDYSKVEYLRSNKYVIIICPIHGEFNQKPANHLNGKNGCPKCGCNSVSKSCTKWLDSLHIKKREYVIPFTSFKVDGFDSKTNCVYEYLGSFWHGNPALFNQNEINPKTKTTYGELYQNTLKRIKIIKDLNYKIVAQWDTGQLLEV